MEENLMFLQVARDYNENSIRELSPLALAFLGDAVFELLVRTHILNKNKNPKKLHIEAIEYVKAKGQSDLMKKLKDNLTEEEFMVYKRGRNAKSNTMPKNANVSDYREATGLESLFGYLYLLNRGNRILELFEMMEGYKNEG
ncbi:ribonuclease-3 family protein [Anaerosphaera aminiphila DSM 21120]|uniref:Mini-ribonuclease 3 n=1 Tax=Anaerosphaera aminiphila DSM 21120 TaxID=1120995 RepID=A0A1M5TQZ9_9FIRM|nr:ribonuclease III domain-containing protein [Anaerosphaera aminiphila]SHH53111.1 ribonuclease-3 family protein [Anaerosphaera aminiphila DSM 21120]